MLEAKFADPLNSISTSKQIFGKILDWIKVLALFRKTHPQSIPDKIFKQNKNKSK